MLMFLVFGLLLLLLELAQQGGKEPSSIESTDPHSTISDRKKKERKKKESES